MKNTNSTPSLMFHFGLPQKKHYASVTQIEASRGDPKWRCVRVPQIVGQKARWPPTQFDDKRLYDGLLHSPSLYGVNTQCEQKCICNFEQPKKKLRKVFYYSILSPLWAEQLHSNSPSGDKSSPSSPSITILLLSLWPPPYSTTSYPDLKIVNLIRSK